MKNWIIFNIALLMTSVASAQVQVAAGHSQSIGMTTVASTPAREASREPAANKPVPKITNDDEIADEMDAANASAQATYRKRVAQAEALDPEPRPAPIQRPVQRRAPRPAPAVQQQVGEGDYNPYKAPSRPVYPQTRVVYKQAAAEKPRAQVVAPVQAPRPQYQQAPVQLSPTPSQPGYQINQYPENQAQVSPAEQDWRPPVRRTGLTLLPTLNLGFGVTSADILTNTVTGVSVTHPAKFIYGGGLMAEIGRSTFTLETGVLYITEMISSNYSLTTINQASNDSTVGYMGIPLLAKVNFSVIPHKSRFSVSGGVIPAFLVYNKFDYVTTNNNGLRTEVTNPNDNGLGLGGFRTFNVFATGAVGGDYTIGSQSDLRVELAYRRALLSLTQNQNTFEDVFLVNLSLGFDVNWFQRPAQPVQSIQQYQPAPIQTR